MSRKLVDINGKALEGSTSIAKELLPDWQQGVIVRKFLDHNINKWLVGFGVRNAEQEVLMGFTYDECVKVVRTLMSVLDTFTEEEKMRGVRT